MFVHILSYIAFSSFFNLKVARISTGVCLFNVYISYLNKRITILSYNHSKSNVLQSAAFRLHLLRSIYPENFITKLKTNLTQNNNQLLMFKLQSSNRINKVSNTYTQIK